MIKALIFDLDGTLANTEELHFKAWQETLLANNTPEFSFETFMQYVGTSNEKVAKDYIASHNIMKSVAQLIKEKQDRYMELIPQVQLFAGAREIIEQYQPTLTLALASSSHEKEVRAILSHHGLLDKMSVIFCGDMVQNKKPDPEIYLKTSSKLGIEPGFCLAFEDSSHGINAAKAAGMYGIAIPNSFTTEHDFGKADRVIKSFTQVDDQLLASLSK